MESLWEVPEDLEKYLGWYTWEARLSDKDRFRLAYTRSLMTLEDEEDFALSYANTVESSEYNDAIQETTGDPEARARVKLEGELDSYPYRVDWDADTPEEMG